MSCLHKQLNFIGEKIYIIPNQTKQKTSKKSSIISHFCKSVMSSLIEDRNWILPIAYAFSRFHLTLERIRVEKKKNLSISGEVLVLCSFGRILESFECLLKILLLFPEAKLYGREWETPGRGHQSHVQVPFTSPHHYHHQHHHQHHQLHQQQHRRHHHQTGGPKMEFCTELF